MMNFNKITAFKIGGLLLSVLGLYCTGRASDMQNAQILEKLVNKKLGN